MINSLEWISAIVALIVVVAVISLALVTTRAIVRPVQGVVSNLTELAMGEGDLTVRLPTTSGEEIGSLAKRFNQFIDEMPQSVPSPRTAHNKPSNMDLSG